MFTNQTEKEYFIKLAGSMLLVILFIFALLFTCARKIYAESYVYNNDNRYQFETYEQSVDVSLIVDEIEEKYPVKIIFENNDKDLQKAFVLSLYEALDWYGPEIINKIVAYDNDMKLEFTLQSRIENQAFINDNGEYGALINQPAARVFIHEIYHLIDAIAMEDTPNDIFKEKVYLNEYCSTSVQEDKAVSYEYYYLICKGLADEPINNILQQKITASQFPVETLKE